MDRAHNSPEGSGTLFHNLMLTKFRFLVSGMIGVVILCAWAVADNAPTSKEFRVGAFSQARPTNGPPSGWEKLTFPKIEKQTQYQLVYHQGSLVVQARSQVAASGLIRHLNFDTSEYPWLAWSWKIDRVIEKGDLRHKQGDDYSARIYVAFKFDPQNASWWDRLAHAMASTSAGKELPGTMLTYIWANQAPRGTVVDNPYTEHVKMIVLQSGNGDANQWKSEKRNIADDYHRAFGYPAPPAVGIAIMTDTDNTGESATAFYGDITLSQAE